MAEGMPEYLRHSVVMISFRKDVVPLNKTNGNAHRLGK